MLYMIAAVCIAHDIEVPEWSLKKFVGWEEFEKEFNRFMDLHHYIISKIKLERFSEHHEHVLVDHQEY